MKFSDQFDVGCEVDGKGGGLVLTKLGRIEATPSTAAAAAAAFNTQVSAVLGKNYCPAYPRPVSSKHCLLSSSFHFQSIFIGGL